jgi:hypothetical protein
MNKEFPKVLSYVHPTKKCAVIKLIRNEGEAEAVFCEFEQEFGYDSVSYSVDHIDDLATKGTPHRGLIGFQSRA